MDRYYLYDGQLSTRGLVAVAGDLTDVYLFDAFGVLKDQAGVTENHYLYGANSMTRMRGFS